MGQDGMREQEAAEQKVKLPLRAEVLMRILIRYCGVKRYCWPSQKKLAAEMGISTRQVSFWITYLDEADCIEVERTNRTNRYWIPSRRKTSDPDVKKTSCVHELNSGSSSSNAGDAAAAANCDDKNSIQALEEMGMPAIVRSIAECNPSLAAAVLAHCRYRFSSRSLKRVANKPGYFVRAFRNPERGGFTRDSAGNWHTPPGEPPAKSRQQKEHPRVEQWLQNMHAFDALPVATIRRIEAFVRKRAPLYASASSGHPGFRGECIAMMVQWREEGKL